MVSHTQQLKELDYFGKKSAAKGVVVESPRSFPPLGWGGNSEAGPEPAGMCQNKELTDIYIYIYK